MNNPFSLYASVAHRFRLRLAEWHLAIAMFLAGLVLLLPGETFALDPYIVLRGLAAEDTWGWAMVGVGLVRMMVLGINGSLPRGSPHLRALFSGISAVMWTVLFTGYLSSHVMSLMIAVTGAAIVTEFVNIIRAAGRAKDEDTTRRNGRHGTSG